MTEWVCGKLCAVMPRPRIFKHIQIWSTIIHICSFPSCVRLMRWFLLLLFWTRGRCSQTPALNHTVFLTSQEKRERDWITCANASRAPPPRRMSRHGHQQTPLQKGGGERPGSCKSQNCNPPDGKHKPHHARVLRPELRAQRNCPASKEQQPRTCILLAHLVLARTPLNRGSTVHACDSTLGYASGVDCLLGATKEWQTVCDHLQTARAERCTVVAKNGRYGDHIARCAKQSATCKEGGEARTLAMTWRAS